MAGDDMQHCLCHFLIHTINGVVILTLNSFVAHAVAEFEIQRNQISRAG